MSRQPLWKTDKTRQCCTISGCERTAQKDYDVCFRHLMIGMQDGKTNYQWVDH